MATEEIAFKITTDSAQTEKSVRSIKTELREATQEALNLSRKFGDSSKEAVAAQQKVANLKDEVGDFKSRVDALNPDAKFRAFSQTLQGVAGGFAGLQGAIGLFGTESKDLEKQLLKVQSALALSEGLNSILESKDAFKSLGVVGVQAFNSIKTAIGATGIGLLVVALGAIYANWDKIKTLVGGVSDEQEKLNETSKKNLKTQQESLSAIDEQTEQLKAQGKSEKEILQIKGLRVFEAIKEAQINIENAKFTKKSQVEASERNFAILKGLINLVSLPITALLYGIDLAGKALGKNFGLIDKYTGGISKLIFDPKETAKQGDETIKEAEKTLNELKEKQAGYKNQIKDIEAKAVADKKISEQKIIEDKKTADDKLIKKIQEDAKARKDKADADAILEAQTIETLTQIEQEKSDKKDASALRDQERASSTAQVIKSISDTTLENDKLNYEARLVAQNSFLQATAGVFGQLSSLFGEGTAASKAAGLAEIAIQTGVGFANGLRIAQESAKATGPAAAFAFPIFYATQIGAVLAAASKAKSILSKVKGGGGGGSSVSSPSIGGGGSIGSASISASLAPIQSGVAVQQTSSIGTSNVNVQNQQTIKAYVVESDITDSQDRINKIKAAATI
jgi:hypothetical protein